MPTPSTPLPLILRLAGALFLVLAVGVFALTAAGTLFDEAAPEKNYAVVLLLLASSVLIEAGRYVLAQEWATTTGGFRALVLVALALNVIIGALGAIIAAVVLLGGSDAVPAAALLGLFIPIVANVIVAVARSLRRCSEPGKGHVQMVNTRYLTR